MLRSFLVLETEIYPDLYSNIDVLAIFLSRCELKLLQSINRTVR